MMKLLLATVVLLVSSSSFASMAQKDLAPGGIKLLPGYQHKTLQGIDTRIGRIWKDGGLDIK